LSLRRNLRVPAGGGDAIQLVDEDIGGDVAGDQAAQALAGVLVHD